MEHSMHSGTGVEFKVIGLAAKTLFLPLIVLYFSPIYDWIVLQIVTDYSLLNPIEKAIINDSKLIGGLFIMIFALIKLMMGIYKIRKEIKLLNKKDEK